MAEFQITTDLAVIRDFTVAANFDELLAAVAEISAPYEAMIVTPDTVRNAAADRAKLRKLQSRIDEQRKAVKAACMAPAEAFAEKMKPALDRIGAAIDNLDRQVKAFEAQEAEEKLERLRVYFGESLNANTKDCADWEKIAARHRDWKNKGKSEEQCRSEIQIELANIDRSVNAMQGYPEQYKAPMMEAFCRNYELADALTTFQAIKRQEQIEQVRREREAEEARKAAEREAALKQAEAAVIENPSSATTAAYALASALQGEMSRAAAENAAEGRDGGESAENEAPKLRRVEFWVEVSPEQSKALGRFLKENRIRYGALRREG